DANLRLKKDRVAQPVRARQNADRTASQPCNIINRGLDHSIRRPDDIRFLGANRDGEALVPVRFDGISEDRSWVRVLGEVVGPRQHCAKRADSQTADSFQELPALKSL